MIFSNQSFIIHYFHFLSCCPKEANFMDVDLFSRSRVDAPIDEIKEYICHRKDYSRIRVYLVTVAHDMVDTLANGSSATEACAHDAR